MPSPEIHSFDSPDAVSQSVRALGKRIVVFVGYAGAGYEDEQRMRQLADDMLAKLNPLKTAILIGATAAGIGAVYELAKHRGFETVGIVSSAAKRQGVPLSEHVDRVFYVSDERWGGYLPGTTTLSPTSQAMVDSGDEFIGIGGGIAARDELLEARRRGKPITMHPADMNHRRARESAAAIDKPEPRDFRGAAHKELVDN